MIFVFAFALIGAGLILLFVGGQLSESRQALNEQRAEKALTQFDSKAALVALGNTDTQKVSFASGGSGDIVVRNGTGRMRVTIDNQSDTSGPETLLNQSLGAVVYESGDTEIGYQGGGVWQSTSNNTEMVSPPEFHFRNGTLTLPIVNVTGDHRLDDDATITHRRTSEQYPNASANPKYANPLTDHKVKVIVQSNFYKGWGEYFEERTTGEVTYNHNTQKATLTLVSPIGKKQVTTAIASLSTSGSFTVSGSSADPCSSGAGGPPSNRPYADSYNSSGTEKNFCDLKAANSLGSDGNITYGGDIDLSSGSGGSDVIGSLKSGSDVTLSGSGGGSGGGAPAVTGDVFHTDGCSVSGGGGGSCSGEAGGEVDQLSGGLEPSSPINGYIDSTVSAVQPTSANDNDAAPITSNRLDFDAAGAGDTVTLTAGAYYLDEIDFSGGNSLNIDTTSGNVTLAINEHVDVSSATINVSGDNTTRIYVRGQDTGSNGNHLRMSSGDIEVKHDDAPELRVYGKDDFTVSISDGQFTGVLYAPPGRTGTGSLTIDHGALFGGAIIGDTTLDTQASVHYDEALKEQQIVSQSAKVVKVTYLHISINQIQVSD
ncbi:DUF7289 family protein [Salinibaculum salinum]|uniref:DUF7289 family protein n=1 Tax=Salinibaculum salinum TaxID=3131996 RepID=UPI0030EDF822